MPELIDRCTSASLARSSRTRTLIGLAFRVIVGKKSLDDDSVDVRRRDGSAEDRVSASDVLKWVTQS